MRSARLVHRGMCWFEPSWIALLDSWGLLSSTATSPHTTRNPIAGMEVGRSGDLSMLRGEGERSESDDFVVVA